MKNNMHCRICGLDQTGRTNFWGEDNNNASFEICDCCGVEFGYEDITHESAIEYRGKWLQNGAQWFNPELKPKSWNFENQIKNIPAGWR